MVEKARQIREVMRQSTPAQRSHRYAFRTPLSTLSSTAGTALPQECAKFSTLAVSICQREGAPGSSPV